ncbi:Non-specific lipid-transfer protein 1-like protein [Drosera capensis]
MSGAISGLNLGKAAALPGKCGVRVPYAISPSTDCSKVNYFPKAGQARRALSNSIYKNKARFQQPGSTVAGLKIKKHVALCTISSVFRAMPSLLEP